MALKWEIYLWALIWAKGHMSWFHQMFHFLVCFIIEHIDRRTHMQPPDALTSVFSYPLYSVWLNKMICSFYLLPCVSRRQTSPGICSCLLTLSLFPPFCIQYLTGEYHGHILHLCRFYRLLCPFCCHHYCFIGSLMVWWMILVFFPPMACV